MNWVTSDDPKFTDVNKLATDILALIGYGYVHWVSTLEEKGQYEIVYGGLDSESSLVINISWLELGQARFKKQYDDYVANCTKHILGVSPHSSYHKNRLVQIYSARLAEIETQLSALQKEKAELQTKRENIKPYQTDDAS